MMWIMVTLNYQVIKINPTADTTTFVGTSNTAGSKYVGAILPPNGKIYFVPNVTTQWMVLDPETDTTSISVVTFS